MRDLELFAGKKIDVPVCYIARKQNRATYQELGTLERLAVICSDFRGAVFVKGAGPWVQQEQPDEVVRLVLDILKLQGK